MLLYHKRVAQGVALFACQTMFLLSFGAYSQEPSLKLFGEIYKSKYEVLKAYKVQYQVHNQTYTENHVLQRDATEVYEFSRLGGKFSKKLFSLDDAKKTANARYWMVYNAGESRYLQYGDGKGVLGRIEVSDDSRAYEMGITSYLALMGLHSGAVVGADTAQFVATAHTADMLACFARTGTTIKPDLEKIDGENCYVVETADGQHNVSFRVWLAVDKGLAVAKRETYLVGRGILAYRVTCSDFREYSPGLYLASRIVVDSGLPTSEGKDGPLYTSEEYKLSELSLNPTFDENAFAIAFPAGTYVDDKKANIEYRIDEPRNVTASLEEDVSRFQSEVRTAKDLPDQVAGLSPIIASDGTRTRQKDLRPKVIAAVVAAFLVSLFAAGWRLRRISRSKQVPYQTSEDSQLEHTSPERPPSDR